MGGEGRQTSLRSDRGTAVEPCMFTLLFFCQDEETGSWDEGSLVEEGPAAGGGSGLLAQASGDRDRLPERISCRRKPAFGLLNDCQEGLHSARRGYPLNAYTATEKLHQSLSGAVIAWQPKRS